MKKNFSILEIKDFQKKKGFIKKKKKKNQKKKKVVLEAYQELF